MAGIADHWKAFSGFNNRDGLLIHPINTDFRRYLIHYGERVGAKVVKIAILTRHGKPHTNSDRKIGS
ncbi:hypothetical protein NC653_034394 [Populus alba x Populus x berolinensis]|uniref:Uncharacterized protein n=1 Tax=Populus alba x Populus x berolinensis TaxID=444605 RepID=A0AAD6LMP2_9ROSI|nr:hypothetical protein NC653_034394 [Populus alba x Populus x berolinensis]